ncbi:Hydroxyacid oxidase 1 [Syncephalis pseudoplumigaleata]|uniref:Oxidase FUB9 n=1 Tax=Syncephalis pseudoplumigaleata TaxID=1712513 RepID=A0A4P9Z0D1_9FUNG|nr:Hydroxyacid oxidase 1 [Syncephalis pseudoplumigaleata]|eukprot:RKP25705.1 Hydroxyacid oxidase 1 [Syncephalis pseudoplumigaleata]
MTITVPVCIGDLEPIARDILSRNAWDYYASGADDMLTLRENERAFSRIRIRPQVLRDVSAIDIRTSILGSRVASPFGVAPTAMQRMANVDGEEATARACASLRVPMILSSWATTSLEDMYQGIGESVRWFQLYVYKDRRVARRLVERAAAAGYKALAVTVDTPYLGRRRADIRNKFKLPSHLRLANFSDESKQHVGAGPNETQQDSGLATYVAEQVDPSLSWKDIAWLKTVSPLPVVVKGVLTAEDARLAVEAGVSGIVVSNHGGRQLDGVSATVEALSEVIAAVDGQVEVFLDGGIRRGSDIFKAIALGAKAVFVGRPILWGLAYKGEEGVKWVLRTLEDELKLCMTLAGRCGDGERRMYLSR